jgi:GT2 family glycosyltransferase/2-polyprenyl-3-methyl-5-hydroxy-6-metoxy-1,4-benzoquinol methylase
MSGPTASVIVVSWNRSADLRLALEAIFAQTRPPRDVIVVDNASTDDAAAVAASFPAVKLIRNDSNLGFAAANELGLQAAGTADYVALVNNDALLAPDWIEKLVDFLEAHPDAAAAGGKQYFWNDENPAWSRANHYYSYTSIDTDDGYPQAQLDTPDEPREVATLSGAAVMIRRRAIDEVGAPFLDPIFFAYYEETDFFSRALRKGFRLHYTAEPACWHRVRASSDNYQYLFWMFRNRVIWAYRNFDRTSLDRVLREARRRPRFGRSDESRAKRDAWDWLVEHRSLLEEHRARFFGESERGFLELARDVQSRASYYGHPRPDVCALVPESARRVIDFGCAGGALGRALKASRPSIEVRGIEPVAEQAERARKVLDDVMIGGADDPLPASWPAPDCIVFADVLEHLVDPWSAVRRARELLRPGGTLVVSIPNVLHHSVVRDLARGRFDYRDAGVLDRTHLRFFTAATARELVEQAGFQVERMERVVEPPVPFLRKLAKRTKANGRGLRALLADVSTVQYLIVAR